MNNQNRKLSPEEIKFRKLKRSIASCLNGEQLQTLKPFVLKYHKDNRLNNGELLVDFMCKEHEFFGDEESINHIEKFSNGK